MNHSWARVPLGEVLTERREVPSNHDLSSGKVRIVEKIGFNEGRIQLRPGGETKTGMILVRPGDLVVSGINAAKGAIAIYDNEAKAPAAATIHYGAYEPSKGRVDVKFLWWMLRSNFFRELLLEYVPGGIKTELKAKRLLPIPVPLPLLPEQQRIVARIEELATQVNEACTLRQQATVEAQQVMAAEERRLWPDAILHDAPHLKDVTLFLGRGRQSEQGESDHFLIKTQHVQDGHFIPTLMRLAPHVAAKVKPEAMAQDGDILVACSAAGCLGRVARFRGERQSASTDTHVAIARANPQAVDSDYLYAYLRGAQGQYQLRSRERGDWQREKISFRLTELNLNDLRRVPVPIPTFSEQRRIVAELDALQMEVEALKHLQNETAAELEALLPSILDKAFKGQL